MRTTWVWLAAALLVACSSADRGGSLRGALEALQRRQRGRVHVPIVPPADYDALYEFVPPQVQYPENDYVDVEDINDEQSPKYIVKLLDDNEKPSESYEYKIIKKKNSRLDASGDKKESAFRERSQHSDNDRLRDLFMDRNESEEKEDALQDKFENDAEYALLLGQLWSKYKNNRVHSNNVENAPQGVVKMYKEKIVKKRYPENWGPIAFKRKRSSDLDTERSEYEGDKKQIVEPAEPNDNAYEVSFDDKDDMGEEYAIAFQPLDDENLSDLSDDDQYAYDSIEKRFPVTKRSSGPYNSNMQKKRYILNQSKRGSTKTFRSSAGTDPKIIKDLSKIFGDSELEIIKTPVKRSSDHDDTSHVKPPVLTTINNNTHDHNNVTHDDDSHEQHGHNIHHPGFSGKEIDHEHEHHDHDHVHDETDKPKTIKKKSIDWSDYFGIDKRLKKSVSFVNNLSQDRLKKQYFDTFNKEVIYPLNSFRKHTNVKRNYAQSKSKEEREGQIDSTKALEIRDAKRNTASDSESKLDNIDKKLRNMEGLIVDEALHYSTIGEQLDSKEEQEVKEKLLSRLAAAYSLEKMRKALKEFKQSLQTHKAASGMKTSADNDEVKDKRVAIKKEKAFTNDISNFNKDDAKENDFEDEQGAGHYLNGKIEEQLSEGYMGGSGRHRSPVMSTAGSGGSCPVLAKIMQRCRGVDLLAGDRGQLFLPLCSLHQICYLCGEAPPTTCDLVFLSEADTTCEGDMSCQRAARSALMALRELHDNLADELDGECEASPCLPATLKLNIGWQRALQRWYKQTSNYIVLLVFIKKSNMDVVKVRKVGYDNPTVTDDDDSNLRPDLVISVQPPSFGGTRAELPVSTLDWRSSNRGQFIPMHGLDFLIGASSIQIRQTVELNDLTSRIDSENRYIVKIPNGEALYIASEVSSSTQRCLCGTGRAFVMHLHDNTRQEAMVLERRLAAASCLFPCRLQEMKVITPPGDYVGRIQQQWTWVVPYYLVRNACDDVIFVIEGPAVIKRSALMLSEFKILTADGLREIGKIAHGWDRELVSFTTTVIFPETTAQPKYKALLLAAAFLLEYTYFERAKSNCLRCNCC
ncbi:uncharacterized protein [Epargyreus clarus]|uniref:uncharacterized protein n=1 Tax=Epargyreus clarus TaxID=520877 RepID=UPI003C2BC487